MKLIPYSFLSLEFSSCLGITLVDEFLSSNDDPISWAKNNLNTLIEDNLGETAELHALYCIEVNE